MGSDYHLAVLCRSTRGSRCTNKGEVVYFVYQIFVVDSSVLVPSLVILLLVLEETLDLLLIEVQLLKDKVTASV